MADDLLQESRGGVIRLTLNRPERRNALSRDLLGGLGRGNLASAAREEFRNLAFQKVLEHRW